MAGDVKRVAGFPAGAQDAARARDSAGEGDVDEKRAGAARGLAASETDAEPARGAAQTGVNRIEARDFFAARCGDGDEGVCGLAAHRGDVTERAAERLPADAARVLVGEKMDAFDDAVGLEQRPHFIPRTSDDGAVVAGTDEDIRAAREAADEAGDERVFAELREGYWGGMECACHARTASWLELKSACIAMGTRIEPENS